MKSIQFIQVTPEQLQEAIISGVNTKLEELKKDFEPKSPTEYITLQQGADLLHVDISTIHNWRKRGVLKGYGILGRVLMKRLEVEAALIELKPSLSKTGNTNKKN